MPATGNVVVKGITYKVTWDNERKLFKSGAIIELSEDDCTYQLNPDHSFTHDEVVMLIT